MSKVWRISLKAITDIKNFNVLANKVWRNSIDLPNSPNFSHAKLSSFMVCYCIYHCVGKFLENKIFEVILHQKASNTQSLYTDTYYNKNFKKILKALVIRHMNYAKQLTSLNSNRTYWITCYIAQTTSYRSINFVCLKHISASLQNLSQ